MSKEIKIPHPEYGHVIFTEPTSRQEDILKDYIKLKTKEMFDNDYEEDWKKTFLEDYW
jgi:hypothetical protein